MDMQSMKLPMKCLVCLSTSVHDKVYHSLSSSFPGFLKTQTTVLGVLQIVSNRKLKLEKNWPDEICTACLKGLKDTHKFIQQLITSCAHLRRKSKELKAKLNDSNRAPIEKKYEPQVILKEYETETTEDKDSLIFNSLYDQSKPASLNRTTYDSSNYTLEIDPASSDLLIPLYSEPVNPPETKIYPLRQTKSRKGKAKKTTLKRRAKKTKANVLVEVKEERRAKKSNANVLVEDEKILQEPNITLEHNYTRSLDYPLQSFELASDEEVNEEITVPNTPAILGVLGLANTREKSQTDITEIEQIIFKSELSSEVSAENNLFSDIENGDIEASPDKSVAATEKKLAESPRNDGGIIMMSVADVLKSRSRGRRKKNGTTPAASRKKNGTTPAASRKKNGTAPAESRTPSVRTIKNQNQTKNLSESSEQRTYKHLRCDFCPKKFGSPKGVTLHTKYAHNKEYVSTRSKCKDCDLTFRTISAWTYHRNKFHTTKMNKCDQCNKEFPTNHCLNEHRNRVHVGITPSFMCNECGKMFKYSNALRYHLVSVHKTGEREYLCNYCGYKAITLNQLNIHENTHSEERPFKCKLCPNTYKRTTELLYHNMKIHERKSLHHCKFCGKGFVKLWNMKIHWMQHGGDYKCNICPKAFKDEDTLKFHYKFHHKDLVTEVSELDDSVDMVEPKYIQLDPQVSSPCIIPKDVIYEQGDEIYEQGDEIDEQGDEIDEQGDEIDEQGDEIYEQGDETYEHEEWLLDSNDFDEDGTLFEG